MVTIVRPDSAVVYPTYKKHNDTTGVKRNYVDLEVIVTYKDDPVPNYWVKVTSPALVDSGGHSHGGTRPMGRYNHPLSSTDTLHTTDTLMVRTDAAGKATFRYIASQFGGVEQITARLMSDTTRFDTLSLITRVPGLELLPENTNYYNKIGGTTRHHGPPGFSDDNNHWAHPAVVVWLDSIARQHKRGFNSSNNIKYNDISLPYGGGFDILGQWETDIRRGTLTGHQLHRVGKSVDVRTSPPNADGVPIARRQWLQQKLREFDRQATVDIHSPGTSNQHFHFQFTEE